jgi:hypothetical protein
VRYELASIRGLEEIAHGALATVLGVAPSVPLRVEDVSEAPIPKRSNNSYKRLFRAR